MLRKILALLALLICSSAHAEAPEVELHLGALNGDVHLIWVPKNWPAGLQGYNLKRRAGDEVSWIAGKTLRPTAEFMRQVQAPGASFADIGAPLLRNFAHAYNQHFAMIDRFPSGITGEMEYALFAVVRGIEQPRPAARVTWKGGDTVELDVGVMMDKSGWDGTEAYFALDIDKFRSKVTRYYIAEVRGNETRHINSGRSPDVAPFEWNFVCLRPTQPAPDAIRLIAETRFGFQKNFDVPVSGTMALAPAGASTRVCDPGMLDPPVAPVDADALLSSATLWLDATRGVEADNNRVTAWRDRSTSGNDATMTELTRRPHLVPADPESPSLSFRGAQSLALARPVVHDEMTIFIIGRRTGTDNDYGPVLASEGSEKQNNISWNGGLGVAVVGPKFAEPVTQTPFGDTRRTHVLTMRADGEKVSLWRNGRHVYTGTARRLKSKRATGFSFNSVGSIYSATYLNGELYAIVVIPRVLSDAEVVAVHKKLYETYPVLP